MVLINSTTTSEKGDGAEALLKSPKAVVGKIRAQGSRFVVAPIVLVLLLCTVTLAAVTLAVGFWLQSERQLPSFCCSCDKLKDTSGTVRKGKSICCINTESEYVQAMKHMINITSKKTITRVVINNTTTSEKSYPDPEDPRAFLIAEKEKKMLQFKNETITLLHSSPVAAHVLVACTNSSYYPHPHNVQDLPPTRTLELLPGRSLSLLRGVELRRDHLIIQTRGLYLIYSQIHFKVIQGTDWPLGLNVLYHIVERYNRRIPNDGIEKLLQSKHTLPKRAQSGNTMLDFHTSYICGVFELEVNNEVFVRASLEDVVSRYPTLNYIGLVKLGG